MFHFMFTWVHHPSLACEHANICSLVLNRKHSSAWWQRCVFAVIRSEIKVFYRFEMTCWRCWMEFQRITKRLTVCHEGNVNVWAKCHDGLSNTSENISPKTLTVDRLVAFKKRLREASRSAGYTVREHELLGHIVCDVEIFHWGNNFGLQMALKRSQDLTKLIRSHLLETMIVSDFRFFYVSPFRSLCNVSISTKEVDWSSSWGHGCWHG